MRNSLIHLRLRSFPVVFAHYLSGGIIAWFYVAPSQRAVTAARIALGGIVWTLCLNGGTLALNSAYDRDENDIGYLNNPPPIPRHLDSAALALMLVGLMLTMFLPPVFGFAYAVSFLLSLAYSVPPVRLKAVAGADLIINMLGYGALTLGAGAWATGITTRFEALSHGILYIAASFGFLFGAFYPMTQIYQVPDDRARGDCTLVIRIGERRSLQLSLIALFLFAFFQFCAAGALRKGAVTYAGISFSTVLWAAFIFDWLRRMEKYPAQKGMYRALKLWAIADIVTVAGLCLG
jgi:4-hydroxybenzoate polyprenyltransferase